AVGFDARRKKAIPKCPRCPTVGDGHKYHTWDDCPLGGRKHAAGTTAAYCQPAAYCTPEVLHTLALCQVLHTLALCQVFQSAADNGPVAFTAACEQHGAPVVLNDGASAGGVDISGYGFAVGDSEDSDGEDMDVEADLQQLRREVTAATLLRRRELWVRAAFTIFTGDAYSYGDEVLPGFGIVEISYLNALPDRMPADVTNDISTDALLFSPAAYGVLSPPHFMTTLYSD
ncbi:hypothetical protein CYMTET_31070, partial [Cymbomonas tetramitiformis]